MNIISSKLSRNTEALGKMDPFVQLKYQGKEYRTSVKEEAGK